jgi:hypothetical protein
MENSVQSQNLVSDMSGPRQRKIFPIGLCFVPTNGAASLQWLNTWRGMVMSDKPFAVMLNEKHCKARRPRNGLALFHSGKLVKAGD